VVGSDDVPVPVLVTVAPDRRPDITALADAMRATGMTVATVLATVGVVTGTATPAQADAVGRLPGVVAVEPDGPVHTQDDPGAR
jgi:hypothetical protein